MAHSYTVISASDLDTASALGSTSEVQPSLTKALALQNACQQQLHEGHACIGSLTHAKAAVQTLILGQVPVSPLQGKPSAFTWVGGT